MSREKGLGHACGVKVQKVQRVQRVQRGRFLELTGPMGRRVLKFDGAFGPEGCGIALSGDKYKVSVTGLAFCVIWHDTHSGDWFTAFAPPIRLCRTSPYAGGRIKHRETIFS